MVSRVRDAATPEKYNTTFSSDRLMCGGLRVDVEVKRVVYVVSNDHREWCQLREDVGTTANFSVYGAVRRGGSSGYI